MCLHSKRLCPVCGKTTFTEYASHDICGVCFWEDETWCEKYPDKESCANYCSLNEYRARYEKVKMKEFEKWNGFIEELIYFDCPADNEKARLRAELALIEKQKNADFFQKIYDTWHLMNLQGIHSYLTGEAENWYIFYFLDMIRQNPIDDTVPKTLSKVTFHIDKKFKGQAEVWVYYHLSHKDCEIVYD
jgi:hypothetical protein